MVPAGLNAPGAHAPLLLQVGAFLTGSRRTTNGASRRDDVWLAFGDYAVTVAGHNAGILGVDTGCAHRFGSAIRVQTGRTFLGGPSCGKAAAVALATSPVNKERRLCVLARVLVSRSKRFPSIVANLP